MLPIPITTNYICNFNLFLATGPNPIVYDIPGRYIYIWEAFAGLLIICWSTCPWELSLYVWYLFNLPDNYMKHIHWSVKPCKNQISLIWSSVSHCNFLEVHVYLFLPVICVSCLQYIDWLIKICSILHCIFKKKS